MFWRLLPLNPFFRHSLILDDRHCKVLFVVPGDEVFTKVGSQVEVGIVKYIGPVSVMGEGHWFGVEIKVIFECFPKIIRIY